VRSFWSGLGGERKEIVHAPAVAGLMARADALVYDVSDAAAKLFASFLFLIATTDSVSVSAVRHLARIFYSGNSRNPPLTTPGPHSSSCAHWSATIGRQDGETPPFCFGRIWHHIR